MAIDQPTLSAALATLRGEHLHLGELDDSLRRVVEATCGVFYVAATDGRSAALEAAQAETGEGPCVESLLNGHIVQTDDLVADPRWPQLSDAVEGLGVVALLGVP